MEKEESPSLETMRAMRREVEEKGLKVSVAEEGKEGNSKVIASCSYLEEKFQECRKREEVRVDWTTRKTAGSEQKARRNKCDVRCSAARRKLFFQNYIRIGVRKLLIMALVLVRRWRGQAVGISPTLSWNAFSISWKFLVMRFFLQRVRLFSPDICGADVAPRGHTFEHW